jgi:hypothetical protein
MTTTTPASATGPTRWLGALLIAEALLAFAPLAVLAPAIGWPASLGNPAAEQLAAIAARPEAVRLGYALYLLYSMLIAPLMIALAARVGGGLHQPWGATAAALAALSALARSIGILRWLTAMPVLAAAHAGAADDAARAQVELVFNALHEYGGGIGELLGVSLFMALALAALCVGAWRARAWPRALSVAGAIVAAMLAALAAPLAGLPGFMPVAAAVTALSLWMLAAGAWLLRAR